MVAEAVVDIEGLMVISAGCQVLHWAFRASGSLFAIFGRNPPGNTNIGLHADIPFSFDWPLGSLLILQAGISKYDTLHYYVNYI